MKRSILFSLIFSLLILNQSTVKCFDPFGIKAAMDKFNATVNQAIDKFIKGEEEVIVKAKEAFIEAMDDLFNTKLLPMIHQIDAMIEKNLGIIDDMIQKTIDHFFTEMRNTIDFAAQKVMQLVDKTIEEIRTQIIDETFNRADKLLKEVHTMINDILDRIDESIYKASCALETVASRIFDKIKTALPIYSPLDPCRKKINEEYPGHDLLLKPFSKYLPNELYVYRKCAIFKNLDEKTPIKSLLMAYRDLELLAGDMRCMAVSFKAKENLEYYINEMGECSRYIYILKEMEDNFSLLE